MSKLPTRAERFRVIRDAIIAQSSKMRPTAHGKELVVGPFLIKFAFHGAFGPLRGSHLDIWPGSTPEERHFGVFHGNKVCSADWWQDGTVEISTFKPGPWQEELLLLLREQANVSELDWHRRRRVGAPY